jgi:DNA-binding MarR family transcriptional regulator
MDRDVQRNLEILTAIEEGRPLTQRALAQRLGVALGLANLYLKRLAQKGYVKIVQFPQKPAARKRLRYLLTPRGLAEKTKLGYEHAAYSLRLYRRARQVLQESLSPLAEAGLKRVALYGTGDAAELAYLTLREFGLEPVAVFSPEGGGQFLGMPVQPLGAIDAHDCDRVILASFRPVDRDIEAVTQAGIPRDKIVTLRRLPTVLDSGGTP